MDIYLFTKFTGADVVYQKNLVKETFSDVHLHSATKHNQKVCLGHA